MSDLNYAIKSRDMNQTLFAVPKEGSVNAMLFASGLNDGTS